MTAIKRLFFDIETSPYLGWFWNPGYKINLSYDNIFEHAKIICICYKWEGKKEVHSLHWDKNQCDKKQLQKFMRVVKQADEIVGHNSDKFDIKWIRTRCLFHRVDQMPNYNSVDTLKEARRTYRFPTNRLNSIGLYLGEGEKIQTHINLWMKIWRERSSKAMTEMIKYCKQDVLLLERVYVRLKPIIKVKVAVVRERQSSCPECGSDHTVANKTTLKPTGNVAVQFHCRNCGKYHTMPFPKYIKEKNKK